MAPMRFVGVMVEVLGVPERRRARERRVRVEQRGHPSGDRSLRPGHRARHGALLLAREGDRDVRARRAYRFIRALRCEGEREESGRQRNGRGGSVGRSARIVSRLRIIGESGLRAWDAGTTRGSGIGIGHAPRPRTPPASPARRPRAAIEGARHPSTEASRTGPPWCATPTPRYDGAAAVHCGGELKLYDFAPPSSRRARRAAVVHLLRAAAYPSPFESNR